MLSLPFIDNFGAVMHITTTLENLLTSTTIFPIKVKSYKELCSLLGLKPHSNADFRKSQLQELENYCIISRQGNSYSIDEIFQEPTIELKFDGKAKTQELLVYTLLEYLFLQETEEDSSELPYGDIVRTYISRKELSYKLGLCEEVFQEKKRNIYPSAAGMTKQYITEGKFKEDGVQSMSDFVEQFFKLNNKTFNDMLESVVNYIQRHRLFEVNYRYQYYSEYEWHTYSEEDSLRLTELRSELKAKFNMNSQSIAELIGRLANGSAEDSPQATFVREFMKTFKLSYYHRFVYEFVYTKRILMRLVQKNYSGFVELRKLVKERQDALYKQAMGWKVSKGHAFADDTEEKSRIAWEVLVRECIL